jgi:UDP-3-O-[3-hydroxymyristoyl] glucosamine N-acyltransferase
MHRRYFFNYTGDKLVADIAKEIGGEINEAHQDKARNTKISDIMNLEDSGPGDLSFVNNKKYYSLLASANCSACIVAKDQEIEAEPGIILIKSEDPYYAYSKAIRLLFAEKNPERKSPVASSAKIGANVQIGHNVVIEDDVEIGEGSIIDHNVTIKHNVKIGKNSMIGANSYIAYSEIGDNVIVHPGARIGTDGFGFATYRGQHHKILHIGKVVVGNNVEIGANSTIDRGSTKDTIIGAGTMIDNLVQIGHNAQLGRGCVIVAQVGIAGSTKLGDYVVAGGQVGIAGHLNIASQVQIAAQSGIMSDIKEPGMIVGGSPSMPIRDWHKQTILLKQMIHNKNK